MAGQPTNASATLKLRSGVEIDLLNPDYHLMTPLDIAHGLAGEIRYNAQSPGRLSVAQHSYLLARWARACARRQSGPSWGTRPTSGLGWGSISSLAKLIQQHGAPSWIEVAHAALFHDATEAILGDVVRPLKQRPEMQWFRTLEALHLERLIERFGLPASDSPVWEFVEALDRAIVADELVALWPQETTWAHTIPEPLGVAIQPCSIDQACLEWLAEYDTVTREMRNRCN